MPALVSISSLFVWVDPPSVYTAELAIPELPAWTGGVAIPNIGRVLKPSAEYHWDEIQDWRGLAGVSVDVESSIDSEAPLECRIEFDISSEFSSGRSEIIIYPQEAVLRQTVHAAGKQRLVFPLADFRMKRHLPSVWQFVRGIELHNGSNDRDAGNDLVVTGVTLERPSPISLSCNRACQSFVPEEPIVFHVEIINHSRHRRAVSLSLESSDRHALTPSLKPSDRLILESGERKQIEVSMQGNAAVSVGGWEVHRLVARPAEETHRAATVDLWSVRAKPHPYLLLDDEGWQQVVAKARDYEWAAHAKTSLVQRAQAWELPAASDNAGKVFDEWPSTVGLIDVAVAWKLTRQSALLDKIMAVLRRMMDSENGYLARGNAVSTDGIGVHEGMFFTYLSIAYDMVFEEPVLTSDDRRRMRDILERYLDETERLLDGELTYNYSTCANAGGILASLVLQDMQRLDRQLYGRGGFEFQMTSGVQDDGWHQEGATNYHLLILRYYAMAAAACHNWGINLYDAQFPLRFQSMIEQGTAFEGYLGMSFDKWGPPGKSHRSLRGMFDGLVAAMDHDGVVLANNDSRRHRAYDVFEQAYAHYLDPKYAWVAEQGGRREYVSLDDTGQTGWRQLLYGVPTLPDVADPRGGSACLRNVGLGVLRSQSPGREPNEQITAVLKWGTHGGWHGHFDRLSLLSLERYGHALYAPMAGFDGYMRDQYKMWDQASASHNMVVVDEKMQEAAPGKVRMFQQQPGLQVCVAETKARWCQVPDWMKFYPPKVGDNLLATGVNFDKSDERILQRRLLAVTDDYVIVADYLQGSDEHSYDWLLHLSGLQSIEAARRTFCSQQDQASVERVSSYRYFTNCQWHDIESPSVARFDDDTVKTHVHLAWPPSAEEMTAHIPPGRTPAETEKQRRGVLLYRTRGTTARFVAILEPHRGAPRVQSVEARSADEYRVKLQDGGRHTIRFEGFDGDGSAIRIAVTDL